MVNKARYKGSLEKGKITFKVEFELSGWELVDLIAQGLTTAEIPNTILGDYLHKWIKKKLVDNSYVKNMKQSPQLYREQALKLFYKHIDNKIEKDE
jgi:hypothetical protein